MAKASSKANPLEMARVGHRALSEAFGNAGFAIADRDV